MAIDELLTVLEREAEAEAARLIATAEAEALAIEREATARVERDRTAAVERLALTEAGLTRRALASAERRRRERTLAARAAAIDRVFAAARFRLDRLPLERWRNGLGDLVAETIRYLEERPCLLECRPEAAALVETLLADRTGVRVASARTAAPGILGRTEDGVVTVDNTLPERLGRDRAELAIALAARMEEATGAVG